MDESAACSNTIGLQFQFSVIDRILVFLENDKSNFYYHNLAGEYGGKNMDQKKKK